MANDGVKERLIQATAYLLGQCKDAGKVTARQIAQQADANLALINYYFQSKDALINEAVNLLMADKAKVLREIGNDTSPPKQRIKTFLVTMAEMVIDYAPITKPTIPYLLLEGEIELPYYILPMVREFADGRWDEERCRIVAYQLISFAQLVFYRSEEFRKYAGIDCDNKAHRDRLFDTLIDTWMQDKEENEE